MITYILINADELSRQLDMGPIMKCVESIATRPGITCETKKDLTAFYDANNLWNVPIKMFSINKEDIKKGLFFRQDDLYAALESSMHVTIINDSRNDSWFQIYRILENTTIQAINQLVYNNDYELFYELKTDTYRNRIPGFISLNDPKEIADDIEYMIDMTNQQMIRYPEHKIVYLLNRYIVPLAIQCLSNNESNPRCNVSDRYLKLLREMKYELITDIFNEK